MEDAIEKPANMPLTPAMPQFWKLSIFVRALKSAVFINSSGKTFPFWKGGKSKLGQGISWSRWTWLCIGCSREIKKNPENYSTARFMAPCIGLAGRFNLWCAGNETSWGHEWKEDIVRGVVVQVAAGRLASRRHRAPSRPCPQVGRGGGGDHWPWPVVAAAPTEAGPDWSVGHQKKFTTRNCLFQSRRSDLVLLPSPKRKSYKKLTQFPSE